MALEIAKGLSLPLDAVTEKLAWLGRTGSGKTYGCKRFVEQLLRAGGQVLIVDTVGVWPGLRLGPKAFDVPVIGGLYADVPLEPTAGALIADLVVSRGTSLILDVSLMNDSERSRFMAAFGERFFMAKKKSKSAVHVVLEECQEIVPQNPQKGEEKMLHEWTRIVKLGRNFGIGVSFISQRPQEVNKKALNQAECVFAFQLTGPHERKALAYWLRDRGAAKDAEKLDDVLPTLERGAPHVWSPSWLKVSKVVKILPIDTLDTSETPKVGARAFEAKKLTPIDIDAIRTQMAETIERAKADDPKALRSRIAELERQLKRQEASEPERVEVPMFDREAFEVLERQITEDLRIALSNAKGALHTYASKCLHAAQAKPGSVIGKARPWPTCAQFVEGGTRPRPAVAPPSATGGKVLSKCAREILTAIVQQERSLSLVQAAIIAGYSSNSGGVRNAASELRTAGLVEGGNGSMRATEAGVALLGDFERLPTGAALAQHWYGQLGKAEREILKVVVEAYPRAVPLTSAARECGYSESSGGVRNAASKLRTLSLVAGGNDGMIADERLVG